ncbi:histone deacetylase [Rhodopirellula sp. MGV]|uniref:histone deacetylase family protein n=1 Tax=Rhodopirellula sp. MGV TaxID=2023130 RepID=UPI000B95DAEF|nr:histone deacetylase [Rhodopirellula sp. MGV]OYP28301.1 histone deacetylase [Rhodopirellula sp. MGV]
MTLLYQDDRFRLHDTGQHPECAARLEPAGEYLRTLSEHDGIVRPEWEPATVQQIGSIHQPYYIEKVSNFASRGGGRIETDTVMSAESYDVARLATGAVCDAVEQIFAGNDQRAYCFIRPPGHHALAGAPMGFCLFNNIAIGARLAIDHLKLDRVMIVDWDVHHGNGTQDVFWDDAQVAFFSIHRWPFYPGTGDEDETGTGAGLGTTMNVPIGFGTSPQSYLDQFRRHLEPFARSFQPQLLLLSAGFDCHYNDPVGSLGLDAEHFKEMTEFVVGLANEHCDGKLVSVQEGGYDPQAMRDCVKVHLENLAL